jgi:hypothetical protein
LLEVHESTERFQKTVAMCNDELYQFQIATIKRCDAMIRSATFFLAALLAGSAAAASTYTASLAAPTSARFIARDISWNCAGATCVGATDESRPVVLCQSLARRAGRVDAFVVDGRSVPATDLERCIALAKAAAAAPATGK